MTSDSSHSEYTDIWLCIAKYGEFSEEGLEMAPYKQCRLSVEFYDQDNLPLRMSSGVFKHARAYPYLPHMQSKLFTWQLGKDLAILKEVKVVLQSKKIL